MSLRDELLAMEVPREVLKYVIQQHKQIKHGGNSTEDYVTALVASQDAYDSIKEILANYRYAGRTAVNLYELGGVPDEWQSKDFFIQQMVKNFGEVVFTQGVRPNLSDQPKIIKMDEREDSIVLTFSYLGKPRRIMEDYRIVRRSPQLIDYGVIHFNPLMLELRCPVQDAAKYKSAVLGFMRIDAQSKGAQVVWMQLTNLTEKEATLLAAQIGASLRGCKVAMTEGIYATMEVTANTDVADLSQEPRYIDEFGDKPASKQIYSFKFRHRNGFEQDVSYRVTNRGLSFITPVSEEVISYVIDKIINIRQGIQAECKETGT